MPNLRLIKKMHQQFKKDQDSPFHRVNFDVKPINEGIDPDRLEKAISSKIAELGPLYSGYFDCGLSTNLVLLFIDICSFSTKCEDLLDTELVDFLDDYYNEILPIIHEYGGEVDKIMGDGVICLFGPPFLPDNLDNNIKKALECSQKIIKATNGGDYESKIAIHAGEIMYYRNSSVHYEEYTIIGKMMTELFRLESISGDGKINFYSNSIIEGLMEEIFPINRMLSLSDFIRNNGWTMSNPLIIPQKLRGVSFDSYRTIAYNK